MHPLKRLAESWKAISTFPGWTLPEDDTDYIRFEAPLEIEGVTEPGFVLHGGCYSRRPNCAVTFEIRVTRDLTRRFLPLARIDWRSISGGHTNPRRGGSPWAGKRVSETHNHSFDLNWVEEEGRMRGRNLPFAQEIEARTDTYELLAQCAGKEFRISNIDVVSAPEWQYSLL